MKKLFVSIFALLTLSVSVSAQDSTSNGQANKASRAAYRGAKKDKKDKLKDLNLTSDQKKEMKENREEYKTKVAAIDKDQSLSEADKNAKKAALKKDQKSSAQALLTPEQKTKLQEAKRQDKKEDKAKNEKRLADMKTELGLTDEQVIQLRALDVSNHARMKAIRKDSSLDEATKTQQIEAAKQTADMRRQSILTPEQAKKLDDMKKNRKGKGTKRSS